MCEIYIQYRTYTKCRNKEGVVLQRTVLLHTGLRKSPAEVKVLYSYWRKSSHLSFFNAGREVKLLNIARYFHIIGIEILE